MKKGILLLALLLMVSIGGCVNQDGDITDTLTNGTWRVSYFIASYDEQTSRFRGYVFTFMTDGTVSVVRPGLPVAHGTWNEFDNNTRFDLNFSDPGLLEKLDDSWVVDDIQDDEVLLHELGFPFNQFHLSRI